MEGFPVETSTLLIDVHAARGRVRVGTNTPTSPAPDFSLERCSQVDSRLV